jgi:hypothetical protein
VLTLKHDIKLTKIIVRQAKQQALKDKLFPDKLEEDQKTRFTKEYTAKIFAAAELKTFPKPWKVLLLLFVFLFLLLIHVVNQEDQDQDNVLVNQILVIYQEVVHVVNSRRTNVRLLDESDYFRRV